MYTHTRIYTRLRLDVWCELPMPYSRCVLGGTRGQGWAGLRYMRAHGDSPGVWRLQDAASRRCQTTVPRAGVIGGHQLSEA